MTQTIAPETLDQILEDVITSDPKTTLAPYIPMLEYRGHLKDIILRTSNLMLNSFLSRMPDDPQDSETADKVLNSAMCEIVNDLANVFCICIETGYRAAQSQSEIGQLEDWLARQGGLQEVN